jgi:hypothetical protein
VLGSGVAVTGPIVVCVEKLVTVVVPFRLISAVAHEDLLSQVAGRTCAARGLQAAKLEMMRSGVTAYRAPYFWAAFVLAGEP